MPRPRRKLPAPLRMKAAKKREGADFRRLQKLVPEARKLLEANKISATLMRDIAGITPPEDQIAVARALCEGRVVKRAIHTAMSSKADSGFRKRILALCKRSQVSTEDG